MIGTVENSGPRISKKIWIAAVPKEFGGPDPVTETDAVTDGSSPPVAVAELVSDPNCPDAESVIDSKPVASRERSSSETPSTGRTGGVVVTATSAGLTGMPALSVALIAMVSDPGVSLRSNNVASAAFTSVSEPVMVRAVVASPATLSPVADSRP
jgi:hypothetical protein